MDHRDVELVGVFDPEGVEESFVYTVDAPTNLWIGALCDDGSRMGTEFMAHLLNSLIDNDMFNEGNAATVVDQSGITMIVTVGPHVPALDVEAYFAETLHVRVVTVTVPTPPS